eukprot:NODE_1868_length_1046_cov_187.917255.p5 GENE.NODE_1868_length_1046_cov_187.917255~~NODE_1868_length_1046_cov_187.917255.p5  ORF type:complete len:91 (-),score=28.93 NODE_1868_length_1046_cov_187.917255:169-441(-)
MPPIHQPPSHQPPPQLHQLGAVIAKGDVGRVAAREQRRVVDKIQTGLAALSAQRVEMHQLQESMQGVLRSTATRAALKNGWLDAGSREVP